MGASGSTPTAGAAQPAGAEPEGDWKTVMGKYKMDMSEDGKMGEGTSSICRTGMNTETGEKLAIKIYKASKSGRSDDGVKMMKFKRQIQVLKELQAPFVKPSDPRLWAPALDKAKPHRLFMRLWDHSHDARGEIGPDVSDNTLYVITELAHYSMKDYLAQKKGEGQKISKDTVKDMTKALILVMAGLHAKGFVHLDLKPENLMVFDRCLKLIDVDGCVRVGESIAVTNPSISFSPCYCAPEWANFLLEEDEASIVASPALDVWSVGCTICEFVTLDAILKPMYANFLRHSHSHREAGFLFMDWLSSIKKAPLPKAIEEHDKELLDLLQNWLLVADQRNRKSCAECLDFPYLAKAKLHHSKTNPLGVTADFEDEDNDHHRMPAEGARKKRHRLTDHSSTPMHRGVLWKLNQGADPADPSNWLQRDMWVANNGSLCYYSQADMKRLVLLDSHKLHTAEITKVTGLARDPAIRIDVHVEVDECHEFFFAADSVEEGAQWLRFLNIAASMDMMPTMKLGGSLNEDLNLFKVAVKNRRMKVDKDFDQFAPVFKSNLWKVKTAGDAMQESDWFQRQTWLSRNGSLVYHSVREDRDLIFYSANDVARAEIYKVPDDKSLKPFAFQIVLPACEGMVFAPGEFAAETEELREQWILEFNKFKS